MVPTARTRPRRRCARVLAEHDPRRRMFTDLVTIDDTIRGGVSHPLTMIPGLLVQRPALALTTFLHEELRWLEGPTPTSPPPEQVAGISATAVAGMSAGGGFATLLGADGSVWVLGFRVQRPAGQRAEPHPGATAQAGDWAGTELPARGRRQTVMSRPQIIRDRAGLGCQRSGRARRRRHPQPHRRGPGHRTGWRLTSVRRKPIQPRRLPAAADRRPIGARAWLTLLPLQIARQWLLATCPDTLAA